MELPYTRAIPVIHEINALRQVGKFLLKITIALYGWGIASFSKITRTQILPPSFGAH